jgi:nitrogen fixation NifU-like protein
MAMGKTLEEARKITPTLVAQELEGLPKNKFHCSNLGAQALNKAIDDYLKKQGKEVKSRRRRKG